VNGRLHVVGAGIAGLAAALAATRAGHAVTLYEATQQAGGRCRAVEDGTGAASDNGTHVLLGANRHALRFLEAVDARESWVEPEPDGLPVLDLATGEAHRIGLSPWSWLRPAQRPPGLGLGQLARLIRLGLPGPDRSVASVMGEGTFTRALIAPLTVAALNTPPEEASANRLARVLRRCSCPGALGFW
jgi:hydroxysqualene dehydroxylase